MFTLSVIIPTCDRDILLNETLMHLQKAICNIETEIIVVNDSKRKKLHIRHMLPDMQILENPGSGAASSRNYGAKHARGKYLLFLDDDMILLPDSISRLLAVARNHPDACFNLNWEIYPPLLEQISKTLFGKYIIHHRFDSLQGWYGINEKWEENSLIPVTSIASATLCIGKETFEKIGGYAENIPFAGFEDYILSETLRKNNVKMYVYSALLAYHNEVDKASLKSWLERKKRGGATRAAAVKLGYNNLAIQHSPLKRFIYLSIYYFHLKYVFLRIAWLLEKLNAHEKIYFKTVNALLGIYHFEGYWENHIRHRNKSNHHYLPRMV